jgi:phosphoglycolate phosphatase
MTRLAVFDLDGTLADTAPDLVGALNDMLRDAGLPVVDSQATRSVAGRGGRALVEHGWRLGGRPLPDAEIDARVPLFRETYQKRIAHESRLFDGAEAALDRLAADGWRLAICTNKPIDLALELLERLDALGRFDAVLGADSLPVRKPDPRHLLETIARAGGAPGRAAMIGDTRTDLDTARAAGAPIILTSFGYAPESMESLAPDAVIDHYSELDAALDALLAR